MNSNMNLIEVYASLQLRCSVKSQIEFLINFEIPNNLGTTLVPMNNFCPNWTPTVCDIEKGVGDRGGWGWEGAVRDQTNWNTSNRKSRQPLWCLKSKLGLCLVLQLFYKYLIKRQARLKTGSDVGVAVVVVDVFVVGVVVDVVDAVVVALMLLLWVFLCQCQLKLESFN